MAKILYTAVDKELAALESQNDSIIVLDWNVGRQISVWPRRKNWRRRIRGFHIFHL